MWEETKSASKSVGDLLSLRDWSLNFVETKLGLTLHRYPNILIWTKMLTGVPMIKNINIPLPLQNQRLAPDYNVAENLKIASFFYLL